MTLREPTHETNPDDGGRALTGRQRVAVFALTLAFLAGLVIVTGSVDAVAILSPLILGLLAWLSTGRVTNDAQGAR